MKVIMQYNRLIFNRLTGAWATYGPCFAFCLWHEPYVTHVYFYVSLTLNDINTNENGFILS